MRFESVSRRTFLGYGLSAAAASLLPTGRAHGATPPACAAPVSFPSGIELAQGLWQNWSGEIEVEGLWTAVPQTVDDVVRVANWAHSAGWRVRPRGMMHGWSPLGVTPASGCGDRILLVDTTQHLTAMKITSGSEVHVQAGATMEALLGYLEDNGRGFTAVPAPGDVTVGGVLAIDGHGAAVQAVGERRSRGHTYGSVSNLVVSLTAVAWDARWRRYRLRRFDRDHPDCAALLTHLGRAFITSATLRTGANTHLRCVSRTDISAADLFAAPAGAGGTSFASFLDQAGRVESIWYPFTENPWLKVWSVSPTQPPGSRMVSEPYNYPFSDHLPAQVTDLAHRVITGLPELAPAFGQTEYEVSVAGLAAADAKDLWGPAKNLQFYIRPTTLRVTANGYAVLTRRSDVQRVVSEFRTHYLKVVDEYRSRGSYPVNGPIEIRATGLDHPGDIGIHGAHAPTLSALAPPSAQRDVDVAVWFDVLTLPGTPDAGSFFAELERWFFTNYASYATVRPEWSKGWAYSDAGAWTNTALMRSVLRNAEHARPSTRARRETARQTLNRHDPHRIFSNRFLDVLLP